MLAFVRRMVKTPLSPVRQVLAPIVAVMLALLTQGGLQLVIPAEADFPYAFLYLIAVFVVAWWGGYLPGVGASLLTLVAIPWLGSGAHHMPKIDPGRTVLLVGISLAISGIAHAQRRMREALRRANDELDSRVQERTRELDATVEALKSEVQQHKATESKLQIQLERLNLLDQITRAISERMDMASVYQVVIRRLEDQLPVDFGCICLYEPATEMLTVSRVGVRSEALAVSLAMTEASHIPVGQNGLARCVKGQLVYEPDVREVAFPFPQKLAEGGLRAVVSAPLQVESRIFGVLIAARHEPESFSSGECEFLRQLCEHVALATNQAQMYEALQRAYEDLRQTQQTVMQQERLRALGQMASGIAHDINNALSPVALYTEILLETEPELSEQTRKYLETTQRSVEDVAQTVARMREFYRQHEPQLVLEPVNVCQLARQVLELTRARWSDMPQQAGIVIQLQQELPADLPPVPGIESEIREALTNLVFNAVDAMPDGGQLTLRARVVRGPSNSSMVALEVSDTGIGMSETTRRRCLEPFFTTKGERGTGLGLAMVYGIAQRHNAEIEIDSTEGKGTTMRMLFAVASQEASGARNGDAPTTPTRLRLLVVDDDPLLIKSLRDALETDGHLVTAAKGGKEGIEAFEKSMASTERFAAVITDLGMPYVDGRKVAGAVKMMSARTPVILLTGWGQRLTEQGDIPPHVDRVLNKPPKLRDLRTALRELVAERDLAALAQQIPGAGAAAPASSTAGQA